MTVIKSPVKNYNGVTAGVQFKDGAGQTDSPRAIEWLIAHGYVAEPSADEIAAALAEVQAKADAEAARLKAESPPYDADMKIDELREVALIYGVDASGIQKKTDIVTAIDAAKLAKA